MTFCLWQNQYKCAVFSYVLVVGAPCMMKFIEDSSLTGGFENLFSASSLIIVQAEKDVSFCNCLIYFFTAFELIKPDGHSMLSNISIIV